MHETGIVRDLVKRLESIVRDADASSVSSVDIWLGALSQFSPAHFREHFVEEAEGTLAEGAALRIETSDDFANPDALHVMIRTVDLDMPEGDGEAR